MSPASVPSSIKPVVVVDWGRTRYLDARQRQDDLVARRMTNELDDLLVFTEHEPVFTLGVRGGSEAHLLWNEERLSKEGVEVVKTNRGGDITYHGPGQIVGYPIVSLAARKDLHAYLRFLEDVLIKSVDQLGLNATRRDGKTGIWIGQRKVAAIGVAVRRWVAYHGFALNVSARLDHFAGIVPCGIQSAEGTVTSVEAELGQKVGIEEVKQILAKEFSTDWPDFVGRVG